MTNKEAKKWAKRILLGVTLIFFGVVLADSLGVFNPKPYTPISHGDHTHYVPADRDPDVPVSEFPMRPPGPEERITPDGQVVPDRSR